MALALVFASAALHAAWNALLKGTRDPAPAAVLFVGGAAVISAILALSQGKPIPVAAWPATLAAGTIEAIYFATLTAALARLPLGTAYGVTRGGGQLVIWPLSVLFLGESADLIGTLGAGLVAAGLLGTISGPGSRDGLGWAALCALVIGIYPIACKAALTAGAPQAALFSASLTLALPLQIRLLGPERRERLTSALRERPATMAIGAGLCAASFLAFLATLDVGGAGRATALRNTSVLFAAAFAWAQGEPMTTRRALSMGAIAGGAVLLAI